MPTWINLLNDWFAAGRCKKRTGAALYGCAGFRSVAHHIEILCPEEVVSTR